MSLAAITYSPEKVAALGGILRPGRLGETGGRGIPEEVAHFVPIDPLEAIPIMTV